MRERQADRARPGPAAHARRQHPGQGRGGARRGRRRSGSPRARPRSSWTRATARCSRSPTGRASNANQPGAAPDYARQNRAIGATYEPGSTFKAFTVAGALEEKEVTPDTEFNLAADDQGRRPRDRRVARARLRHAHHAPDPRAVLERRRDHDRPAARAPSTSTSGCAASASASRPASTSRARSRASCSPLERYSGSSMGNLPIGQGIAVTPMQMATAYSAIANGGVLRPAHIVESVGGRPAPSRRATRDLRRRPRRRCARMLEGVLGPGGTASGAAIPGYELAGKTGTAKKPDPVNGGYSEDASTCPRSSASRPPSTRSCSSR